MTDDRTYLGHIIDCIQRIEDYTRDGEAAFMASPIIQDAVVRNFEIIGEATKRLSSKLTRSRPDIQWRRIAGFRDVLIHRYASIDLTAVWNVIEHDLTNLKSVITDLLETL
nr:DUF86 domain-containing protein [Oscillochloris trichoides]